MGRPKEKRIQSICIVCGEEFGSKEPPFKARQRKYCSEECRKKASLERSLKKGTKILVKCGFCRKQFPEFSCKVKIGLGRKYCSPECRKQGSSEKLREYFTANPPRWKGGRTKTKEGYIFISFQLLTEDEKRIFENMKVGRGSGYISEHRFLMAKKIGRPLGKNEIVHHINGIQFDNRLENLQLMTSSEHSKKLSGEITCPKCGHTWKPVQESEES